MTELTELYEHYDAVHAEERAVLEDHRQELVDIVSMNRGLYKFTNTAYSAEKLFGLQPEKRRVPLKFSVIKPRLSAVFMSSAWRDLTDTEFICDEDNRYDEQLEAIRQFLDEVVMPMSGFEPAYEPAEAKFSSMYAKDACGRADMYFADTYEQITAERHNGQGIVRVYHNDNGTPLVIQKAQEESSGLTLEPINAEGIFIPAGTIVGVEVGMDLSLKIADVICNGSNSFEVVSYEIDEENLALAPARLSPWAYSDPLDIGMYAVAARDGEETKEFSPPRFSMVSNLNLELFRQAAAKVMKICDFEPARVGYI